MTEFRDCMNENLRRNSELFTQFLKTKAKGDVFAAMRLILPEFDRERLDYGSKESIIDCLLEALNVNCENPEEKQDRIRAELSERSTKRTKIKIQRVNEYLNDLARDRKRVSQVTTLQRLITQTNGPEMIHIIFTIIFKENHHKPWSMEGTFIEMGLHNDHRCLSLDAAKLVSLLRKREGASCALANRFEVQLLPFSATKAKLHLRRRPKFLHQLPHLTTTIYSIYDSRNECLDVWISSKPNNRIRFISASYMRMLSPAPAQSFIEDESHAFVSMILSLTMDRWFFHQPLALKVVAVFFPHDSILPDLVCLTGTPAPKTASLSFRQDCNKVNKGFLYVNSSRPSDLHKKISSTKKSVNLLFLSLLSKPLEERQSILAASFPHLTPHELLELLLLCSHKEELVEEVCQHLFDRLRSCKYASYPQDYMVHLLKDG